MNQPESFSVQQASDPRTPGQVLADIAALRPDLRPAVAANPAAYPGLLEWLGGLGEPAVDAALRARRESTATPADQQQAAVLPTAPGAAPGQSGSWSGQAPPYAGASGTSAAPSGYGRPTGAGGYGVPATAYGYQPTGAPRPGSGSRSNKVLWIVLGVVLGVIALGIVGVVVVRGLVASMTPDAYGSDRELDALYDRCADEDWAACDQLYFDSPQGSDYEEFADTCGHRTDGGSYCVDELGSGDADSDQASTYGDDPTLDALWDACEAGDGQACDDLFWSAPSGSDYEQFGSTCGGREPALTTCAE